MPKDSGTTVGKAAIRLVLAVILILILLAGWIVISGHTAPHRILAEAAIADGRIIQIEGATYGLEHSIGNPRSLILAHVAPWLPPKIRKFLEPKYPKSKMSMDEPGLVVWVNAIDPIRRTNVDCQAIRVELVDKNGDSYPSENSSWYGHDKFWRVGHEFPAFPRTEQTLTLLVTPWKTNQSSRFEFPNPHVEGAKAWTGESTPQRKKAGDMEVVLSALEFATNGSPENWWETQSRYWKPVWAIRQGGELATGWNAPEWITEDPTGNRSRFLGVHQPVLRYEVTFYPSPTNTQAARLLTALPSISMATNTNILWWNREAKVETNIITVLGLFPPGVNVFSDGIYQTNPPVSLSPVRGGAPSGWVGHRQAVNPMQFKTYRGHYTPQPVIYLHVQSLPGRTRLAVRLRDDSGKCWLTTLEPQGTPDGIYAYLIAAPPGADHAVPELVSLEPVEAQFMVKMPEAK